MYKLAILSMHGCPVTLLGSKEGGGMNVYILQVAKKLGELGIKVDVYTRRHDPNDPQIVDLGNSKNARVIHIDAGPYKKTKDRLYGYIPEFIRHLEEFRQSNNIYYDLLHSHYWLSGLAGQQLSELWKIPHITMFHTLAKKKLEARAGERESQLRLDGEASIMSSVDAIVVSTDQEKKDLYRLYKISPRKVWIIPAGVDLDRFQPLNKSQARESLGLTEQHILLYVGRIDPLKGLDTLIHAMTMIRDLNNSRLIIVGGELNVDPELNRLIELTTQVGLQDKITFTGALEQKRLPEYYSATDVFILPSYYESYGLVTLEAMACGVPIVAARVGGPRTLIKEGVTGYLIPWRCPEPYAERIDILLANSSLRESMGATARNIAQDSGWEKVANRLFSLYKTYSQDSRKAISGG